MMVPLMIRDELVGGDENHWRNFSGRFRQTDLICLILTIQMVCRPTTLQHTLFPCPTFVPLFLSVSALFILNFLQEHHSVICDTCTHVHSVTSIVEIDSKSFHYFSLCCVPQNENSTKKVIVLWTQNIFGYFWKHIITLSN